MWVTRFELAQALSYTAFEVKNRYHLLISPREPALHHLNRARLFQTGTSGMPHFCLTTPAHPHISVEAKEDGIKKSLYELCYY